MTTSNYSISYSAVLAASTTVAVEQAMVRNGSAWVVATAANRALYGRAQGIARTAYGGSEVGSVDIQHNGLIPATTSLGAGSASWVRVATGGGLERCTPVLADDVIGYVNAVGDLMVMPFTPAKLDGLQVQGAAQAIAALAIDWSAGGVFTKSLAAGGNTFTFSNAASGMVIIVRLSGHASGSTVTWPTVRWAGGTPPTQTPTGHDAYTFFHDGSNIYGSVVQAML